MGIDEKLAFFDLLLALGFKEIEIGFPSSSQVEFDFTRALIEQKRIPDDVTIQALCQCREHLIRRTFESLAGARKAIFHIYNSTSPVQRRVTFGMSKAEITAIAVEATRLVKAGLPSAAGTEIILEYSPESFSNTEVEFALEVCEAVMDVWGPTPKKPIILNLPATVESCTPNLYADMIEWFVTHLSRRDSAIVSLHTHNDRGTGVAACELGLLAGADRVEGTLFGNGERTGNLDIVTMALNMYSQGLDPALDLFDLPRIASAYADFTGMDIHARHPYAGELVFTAFSGSHQDAIKKGMEKHGPEPDAPWEVPYLPIDPKDLGRSYEAIIRINSQSGKGGSPTYSRNAQATTCPRPCSPKWACSLTGPRTREARSSDPRASALSTKPEFLNVSSPLTLLSFNEIPDRPNGETTWRSRVRYLGGEREIVGRGKGPIEAFVHSLASVGIEGVSVESFHEDSLSAGSDAFAMAYVLARGPGEGKAWGAGTDRSIVAAGVRAVLAAVNRRLRR